MNLENSLETCARKINFCYGHRVMNHEGKCASLHGHNAEVFIHATPQKSLDEIGRVVDFSVLKNEVGGWIDENWDHTTILWSEDRKSIDLVNQIPGPKKVYILDSNPTAENLAKYLLRVVCPLQLKKHHVYAYKVTFWETINCFAEYSLPPHSEELINLYR